MVAGVSPMANGNVQSMPYLGSKCISFSHSLAKRLHVIIQVVENIHVTPPLGSFNFRQSESEEDDHGAQDQTSIQCGGRDVVVFTPPSVPSLSDPQIKDETKDDP